MKQIDRIYRHLQKRPITSMVAFERYGVTRLSSIIFDLRERGMREGFDIISEMKNVKNRHGDTCRIAEYFLIKVKK